MDTQNISGYRTEVLDTPNVSGCSRRELLQGQCEDTDPRKTTAEGSRSDTSWKPSTYGDLTSILMDVLERLTRMENEIIILSHSVNTLPRLLDSHNSAFPVINKQLQEKKENEMLKEKIKTLEARNKELLSKAMAMHQHSEDINDPLHLSAVLERYEILRLREWEKARSSSIYFHWTYEQGSGIIKKLFEACEKEIQQRIADVFKVLDMPPLSDTMTKSKQAMIREIRNLFGQPNHQNYSTIYKKIVKDPQVKADWNIDSRYLEHVDKKDVVDWKKPALLWPIMKRGEETIVKGVVWD